MIFRMAWAEGGKKKKKRVEKQISTGVAVRFARSRFAVSVTDVSVESVSVESVWVSVE